MKRFTVLLLFFVFIFTIRAANRQQEEICSGDILPEFSIKSDDGRTITLDLLKGKTSMIVFFHTQCWDCRKELPVLQDIYNRYASQVNMICISRGEGETAISTYWAKNNLSMPYSAQNDKKIFQLFARKKIPRIYLSDEHGVVRYVFVEKVRQRKLIRSIERILKKTKINN